MSLRNATGRVRVAARARPVDAARRERAAPDADRRVDRLERVVGAREQRQVGGRGGVRAVGIELRQPEAVEVRLVADDHVVDRRQLLREHREVAGELLARLRRQRRRPRARGVDGEVDPDAGELRGSGDVAEDLELGLGRRDLPGSHCEVTRTAVKPASRKSVIFAFAETRSGARTTSSAAPNAIVGPARAGRRERSASTRASDERGAGDGTCGGYASRRGRAGSRAAGDAPAQPGRLPLSRRARRRPLRRQGEVAARPRAQLLQPRRRPARDRADGRSGSAGSR